MAPGSIRQEQSTLHAGWGYLGWLHPGQQGKKTKQKKKKLLETSLPEKSYRKHLGDMAKTPPTAAGFFNVTMQYIHVIGVGFPKFKQKRVYFCTF